MTTQIEPGCLQKLIEKQAVKIIDGSWALDGTDMRSAYLQTHIPGAQFFDIDSISDHTTSLPHMAPSPAQFAEAMGRMGISAADHVVIYDRQGLFSAARVWWTFKQMGHDKVQVLNGGWPAWIAAGLPVTSDSEPVALVTYKSSASLEKIIDLKGLQSILATQDALVLDARSKARFEGVAPEPRSGLRSGHMPGSQNLPFGDLIRDGRLKTKEELAHTFDAFKVSEFKSVVTTCGSGVTAAIISMALYEIGHTDALLYDGSWSEWGQEALETPVVTGAA